MSKFKPRIENISARNPYTPFRVWLDGYFTDLNAEQVSSLLAACQSALCDMNTERMADKPAACTCNLGDFKRYPVCKSPVKQDQEEGADPDFCDNTIRWIGNDRVPCGHSKACHAPTKGEYA